KWTLECRKLRKKIKKCYHLKQCVVMLRKHSVSQRHAVHSNTFMKWYAQVASRMWTIMQMTKLKTEQFGNYALHLPQLLRCLTGKHYPLKQLPDNNKSPTMIAMVIQR